VPMEGQMVPPESSRQPLLPQPEYLPWKDFSFLLIMV
jgi:hypothetical protein